MFTNWCNKMPLNIEQKRALNEFLKNEEKNILVLAPAGTGKTYCCIYYAQEYVQKNQIKEFQKILVLTFSRNARAQIIKELNKLPRDSMIYNHIEITNYHSFMKNYIDRYRDIIGIIEPIEVIDEDEFLIALNNFYNRNTKYKTDLNYLSDFDLINDKLVNVNPHTGIKNWIGTEKEYIEIVDFIKATGKIYFSAFGKIFYEILQKSKDLARYIAHDYPIVILDEYQDTDYFQSKFLELITVHTKNLYFADDCQMIYDFRGASKSRLDDLYTKYPSTKRFEFTDIFRYKNKPDIIQILNSIRTDMPFNYNNLTNGRLIKCKINADNTWQIDNNQGLLTGACNLCFYAISNIVSDALRNKKSICVLTRKTAFADTLTRTFINNKFRPRVIADTKEMMFLNKQLKKMFVSQTEIRFMIPIILSIVASCKNVIKIDDEELSAILDMSFDKLKKKRKEEYRELFAIINLHANSQDVEIIKKVLKELLNSASVKTNLNYVRTNYVLECIRSNEATPQYFDNLLLQKQYVNSFSEIVPGLYITTIHQSKGREFDYVCVIDIDNIKNEKNLLYVSHSRMKEKLFPVVFNYVGVKW